MTDGPSFSDKVRIGVEILLFPVALIIVGVNVGIGVADSIPASIAHHLPFALAWTAGIFMIAGWMSNRDRRHRWRRIAAENAARDELADEDIRIENVVTAMAADSIAHSAVLQLVVTEDHGSAHMTLRIGRCVPHQLVIDKLREIADEVERDTRQ